MPRYRRVADSPPTYKIDDEQLQALHGRRKLLRASRTQLRKQLAGEAAQRPTEFTPEQAALQRKIDSLDVEIQSLDSEVKSAQSFNNAVRNLIGACAQALTINDSRGRVTSIDGSLQAAVAKYTKRIPKSKRMYVVREAFAQVLDPAIRDGDISETFDQFLASIKRSRAWRLNFEKMHHAYEKDATAELTARIRTEQIVSMKQLGALNRRKTINPPRPRMTPKKNR